MPFLGHPFRVLLATAQGFALLHVLWSRGVSVAPGYGPSMMPTFLTMNDWFVTDKRYRRGKDVRVGDCVTFSIPVEPNSEGLKRVIGMPGDYVLLNSPPSTVRETFHTGGEVVAVDRAGRGVGRENMIQVPKGHCYVVGDNLPWSRDSRDYGPIPLALIKGKVTAKVCLEGWNPMGWFSRIENGLQKPAMT
ncbi:peptidase S24/S26A/S26B/S26C [Xylariaceae sp. FL1272]|nr:peptidase S24/S26A/S26B/S26C [Xylariaceae sp. FL1272]